MTRENPRSPHGDAREHTDLGEYLRARRAAVRPEDVGIPRGRRRVPGLRREEVATLAAVSVDYYTRLEQGRERHPSTQTLDALGRVLLLDPDARDHLHTLVGAAPSHLGRTRQRPPTDALLALLDQWSKHPAFVFTDAQDILAANEMGRALHSGFAAPDNFARMVFLDPEGRRFFTAWDRVANDTVATLRKAWGQPESRHRVVALIDELADAPAFDNVWKAHTVASKTHDAKTLNHPLVGLLELNFHTFDVVGEPGTYLLVCQAETGSPSEHSLARLIGEPTIT